MRARLYLLAAALLARAVVASAQPRFRVDTTRVLRTVNRDVYGANLEYTSSNVARVRTVAAQFTALRFPGGDADSIFRWDMPDLGDCGERYTWPIVADFAGRQTIGLFMETNLVHGTPETDAAWVADARRRGLRVPIVAIGNEVWGDFDSGYRPAAQYASDVIAHAAAIRARVAGTRIAAAFGTFNEDPWNRQVVHLTGAVIDAVDLHWYPNHREYDRAIPSEIMAEPEAIPALLARVRGILHDEAPARADQIAVILGEYDCAEDEPPQEADRVPGRAYSQWAMPNAVCYGAAIGEMITGGIDEAHMYAVQGYRFGATQGSACDPGDPRVVRPKMLAHQLWREHFGEQLVAVDATDVPTYESAGPIFWDGFAGTAPYLKAYASLADQGRSLRLIVVSRQETDPSTVTVDLQGFVPQATASAWELAGDDVRATNENVGGAPDAVHIVPRTVAVSGATFTLTVPPHSVTAYSLRRAGAPPKVLDAGTAVLEVDDAGAGDAGAGDVGTPVDATFTLDATAAVDGSTVAASDGGCAAGPSSRAHGRWAWLAVVALAIARRRGGRLAG